jgi:histidinol-phosphate aminotransferase
MRPVPWVKRMAPYAPPEDLEAVAAQAGLAPGDIVKLDANENPYGPSPRVREALANFDGFHLYPDPDQRELRAAVASYCGVDPDQLIVGNGSDELIDLLCRVYLEPGDEAIDCTPTFGMYRFSTELAGGHPLEAPRSADWSIDVDAVRESITERTRLIFVATPNNPTGNLLGEAALAALLDTGRLVVLDEAYVEFSEAGSLSTRVTDHENLVVLRTFSKWAGLAGLRVGYGVFPAGIASHLWKVKPPFNVNRAAEVAVRATIDDIESVRAKVRCLIQERARMADALEAITGLRAWPSAANFMLVQGLQGSAADLGTHLNRDGIAIRTYTHPRLANAIRISVGRPTDTDAVVQSLRMWASARGRNAQPAAESRPL